MIEEKIQRDVFEVINLHEADDRGYWHDRSKHPVDSARTK